MNKAEADRLFDAGEIDQLEHFRITRGYEWPNCATPDCENKSCVPSDRCHPCSIRFYNVDFRETDNEQN